MQFRWTRKLVLTVLMLSPLMSYAKWPGFLQRLEIGYSYSMATATLKGSNPYYDADLGYFTHDTIATRTSHSSFGYGAFIGTTAPLKRLGNSSMLALSFTLMANAYLFGDFYKVYTSDGSDYALNSNIGGLSFQYGVPVSLDLKMGGEAVAIKNKRFCGTVGAGVFPAMYVTIAEHSLDDFGGGLTFNASPFVKAEVGVFAGICFKIRALYTFGSIPLIDEKKSLIAGTTGGFTLTGNSTLNVSIIIMPFSWTWKREAWWNNNY